MTDSRNEIERARRRCWIFTLFILGGGFLATVFAIVLFVTSLAEKLNGF